MPQPSEFKPWDWQWAPFLDKHETMLLSGKPGGGKSYLVANKIHGFLLQYPGATAVASRKVKEDMDQSTIPLFLDKIIDINNEPRCHYQARRERVVYSHDGGQTSTLLFKGMNTPRQREGWKSLGTDGRADLIWFEEATEYEEEDFNYGLTRLHPTVTDWRQLMLTTNPDMLMHWIHVRLIMGNEAAYYYSDWTMNPSINEEAYTSTMSRTTGITNARMFLGQWTDGIGRVIDTWKDSYHEITNPNPIDGNVLVEADYIPGGGPVVWVVDDGYAGEMKSGYFTAKSSPRAFLLAQKRPNSQLAVFDEHYAVKLLEPHHIVKVLRMCNDKGYPVPEYALYDGASPTLGRYLEEAGLNAIPFRIKISEGLEELRSWIGPDLNGIRRLIVHPRVEQFRWENISYVYGVNGKPIDAFNHGPDGARYLTSFISFGEPEPVSILAPGIDVDQLEETVRKVMLQANQESTKLIDKFIEQGSWY